MNQYRELLQKHQQEVNVTPNPLCVWRAAISGDDECWGLDPEKTSTKIYRLGDAGGFYLRTDARLVCDTFCRLKEEREAAIAEDKTGDGFIYQMFLCELANHEYNYTEDVEETLDALGYTWEQIMADKRSLMDSKWPQKKIQGRDMHVL